MKFFSPDLFTPFAANLSYRNQAGQWSRRHLLSCDEPTRQLGNVNAPAQVLNAVPETFSSALRNSAEAKGMESSARSFPQRGNSLRPPPSLFSPSERNRARSVVDGLPHPYPSPWSTQRRRLPSENAPVRLNLRGRFSISKLSITYMGMLPMVFKTGHPAGLMNLISAACVDTGPSLSYIHPRELFARRSE